MKKASIKKLSILGLVLLGASAVTAALLDNKANSDMNLAVTLTQRSTNDAGAIYTCKVTNDAGSNDCTLTFGSAANTTGVSYNNNSTVENYQTIRNTTTVPL